jgi:hypothetical protein
MAPEGCRAKRWLTPPWHPKLTTGAPDVREAPEMSPHRFVASPLTSGPGPTSAETSDRGPCGAAATARGAESWSGLSHADARANAVKNNMGVTYC